MNDMDIVLHQIGEVRGDIYYIIKDLEYLLNSYIKNGGDIFDLRNIFEFGANYKFIYNIHNELLSPIIDWFKYNIYKEELDSGSDYDSDSY